MTARARCTLAGTTSGPRKRWLAEHTNAPGRAETLQDALHGADVFIGASAGGVLGEADVAAMAERPIVFALANPDPEIDPQEARRHAAVVATGRSDQPNQIDNALAFPGVFRGLLDGRRRSLTTEMQLTAAAALSRLAPGGVEQVVPQVFDERLVPALSSAGPARTRPTHRPEPGSDSQAPGWMTLSRR